VDALCTCLARHRPAYSAKVTLPAPGSTLVPRRLSVIYTLNKLVRSRVTSEPAYRRGSVHRAVAGSGWVVIHLSGLPGDIGRASRPTFDLAPGGVCRAAQVALGAGALLPHRFTLTSATTSRRLPLAVCFLWHFPAGHPDWPLASTLPFGAPTFLDQVAPPKLSGARLTATTWPAQSSSRSLLLPHAGQDPMSEDRIDSSGTSACTHTLPQLRTSASRR